MDAVHLMRAITGRDLIIKVEGCYHGHHDSVQVSVLPEADEIGPREHPTGVAGKHRHPRRDPRPRRWSCRSTTSTRVERAAGRAPGPGRRHDPRADHDERRASSRPSRLPRRAARTCCTPTARCSTFDEVKTGFTTGPGGATARYGVVAGHRLPGQGARRRHRGRRDRRHRRGDGARSPTARYEQVGTFNGNPLAMAAARATLTEVLTDDGVRAPRRALAARLRDRHRGRRSPSTGFAVARGQRRAPRAA